MISNPFIAGNLEYQDKCCPFCKCNILNLEYYEEYFCGYPRGHYYVKCPSCKMQGPEADIESEARQKWNDLKRA